MRASFRAESGLLPRDVAGETWLAGVIAVLCFIACLAAVGAALLRLAGAFFLSACGAAGSACSWASAANRCSMMAQ